MWFQAFFRVSVVFPASLTCIRSQAACWQTDHLLQSYSLTHTVYESTLQGSVALYHANRWMNHCLTPAHSYKWFECFTKKVSTDKMCCVHTGTHSYHFLVRHQQGTLIRIDWDKMSTYEYQNKQAFYDFMLIGHCLNKFQCLGLFIQM